jgi:protein-tyrosine phosphatase
MYAHWLGAGLIALNLATAAPAAASVLGAEVVARADGRQEVRWTTGRAGEQVDVYVADRPSPAARRARRIASGDRDGSLVVSEKPGRRAYYFVASRGGKGLWTSLRVLPLEGGQNFRDLGGYATRDGRRVRWGQLYRSADISTLTASDFAYLRGLGVRVICDLRSTPERAEDGDLRARLGGIDYWTRDHAMSLGDLPQLIRRGQVTRADTSRIVLDVYRTLPYEQADSYREMFRKLLAGDTPLTFNCTGGKDRTGVAAALILSLLGVPRATILQDFTLSDKLMDYRRRAAQKASGNLSPVFSLAPDVLEPLLVSDAAYLQAMFAAIEAKHGSVEGYARDVLGLRWTDIVRLRQSFLESNAL